MSARTKRVSVVSNGNMPAMPVDEVRVSKTAVGFSGVVSTAGGVEQPAAAAATAMAIGLRMIFALPCGLCANLNPSFDLDVRQRIGNSFASVPRNARGCGVSRGLLLN